MLTKKKKKTHISRCKIVHLCTITILTVHIYMVTITRQFIILLIFSLLSLVALRFSHFFSLVSASFSFSLLLLAPTLVVLIIGLTVGVAIRVRVSGSCRVKS